MSTAREESETFHKQWQELAEDLCAGRPSRYRPLSLVKEPFRSLLLGCVNEGQKSFIEPTLESLKMQTFQDFELILIDHFADERRHITERYRDKLQIKHVREKPTIWHELPEPKGFETPLRMKYPSVCNARDTGIILADGKLLVFLDDNIILEKETLKTCWEWYKRDYDLKIARHRFNILDNKITLEPDFRSPSFNRLWSGGWQPHECTGMYSNAMAVSLDHVLALNGFDESFDGVVGCEDLDFGLRLKNLGAKCAIDRNAVAWELGHYHIQHGRYNVRANFVLFDLIDKTRVRANDERVSEETMRRYAELHEQRREKDHLEHPMHPFFNKNCEVPPFDLKDLRMKYRVGEFKW